MSAATIVKPNQKIEAKGAEGFLLWLRRDMPDVFEQVTQKVPAVSEWAAKSGGLGFDFSSIFSGLGTALTNALPTIAQAAGTLAVSNSQKKLIDAQAKLAQAQQQPLQTGYVYTQNGQQIQQVQTSSGYPMTTAVSYSGQQPAYNASGIRTTQQQGTIAGIPTKYLLLGGGVLLLAVFAFAMRGRD